ncbi:MAG TPA: hypothetical protein VFA18_12880 [Gemmataceae bacterium]|nr:hypothetical protein [Gemmataceae bacterium]
MQRTFDRIGIAGSDTLIHYTVLDNSSQEILSKARRRAKKFPCELLRPFAIVDKRAHGCPAELAASFT